MARASLSKRVVLPVGPEVQDLGTGILPRPPLLQQQHQQQHHQPAQTILPPRRPSLTGAVMSRRDSERLASRTGLALRGSFEQSPSLVGPAVGDQPSSSPRTSQSLGPCQKEGQQRRGSSRGTVRSVVASTTPRRKRLHRRLTFDFSGPGDEALPEISSPRSCLVSPSSTKATEGPMASCTSPRGSVAARANSQDAFDRLPADVRAGPKEAPIKLAASHAGPQGAAIKRTAWSSGASEESSTTGTWSSHLSIPDSPWSSEAPTDCTWTDGLSVLRQIEAEEARAMALERRTSQEIDKQFADVLANLPEQVEILSLPGQPRQEGWMVTGRQLQQPKDVAEEVEGKTDSEVYPGHTDASASIQVGGSVAGGSATLKKFRTRVHRVSLNLNKTLVEKVNALASRERSMSIS